MYKTQAEFAAAAGRHQGTVSRDFAKSDCPISPDFPKDDDDLKTYLDWIEASNAGPLDDRLKLQQIRKSSALADRYEYELAVKCGEVIAASEVARAISTVLAEYRDQMLVMSHSVAPLCAGLSTEDIEKLITQHAEQAINTASDRLEQQVFGAVADPNGGAGGEKTPVDGTQRLGGVSPLHAEVADGGPRAVEE